MKTTGKKKIETDLFSAAIRINAPSVVVDDETLVPKEFWKPQPDKLDTKGLSAFLKENGNKTFEYAHLECSTSIIFKQGDVGIRCLQHMVTLKNDGSV